jgi:hypothetical protein
VSRETLYRAVDLYPILTSRRRRPKGSGRHIVEPKARHVLKYPAINFPEMSGIKVTGDRAQAEFG